MKASKASKASKLGTDSEKDREVHGRKIESWMELSKREIIDLNDENWHHYKNGVCLCSAHCDCECVCGAWRQPNRR